jgi:hypothetical protein
MLYAPVFARAGCRWIPGVRPLAIGSGMSCSHPRGLR